MVKLQVAMIVVISYVLEIPRYLETKLEEVTCNGYTYVIWHSTQLMENDVYTILYRIYFYITIDHVFNSIPYWLHVLLFDKILDSEKKNKKSIVSFKGIRVKNGKTQLR